MTEHQLTIDGIGQQKATLSDWKNQKGVYTHKSDYSMPEPWSAWAHSANPLDLLEKYGDGCFGFGNTEKAAILNLCLIENIEPPFWW